MLTSPREVMSLTGVDYHEALMTAQAILAPEPVSDASELAPVLCLLDIKPGASVLDLGCGAGAGVAYLESAGFNAHGTDIFEYWGSQSHLFWQRSLPRVPRDRLRVATLLPYRLPFPDNTFDHLVSMQVIEHVDDRAAMFAEIARVLKPGGTSAHIYPDAWRPVIEGHIGVPLAILCRFKLWLLFAALAGFRSGRQRGLHWREAFRSNVAQMEMTHYPSSARVLREARGAGLRASFATRLYVKQSNTGWTRVRAQLGRCRLGWLVDLAARVILQPRLVLTKPALTEHGEGPVP